MAWEEFNSQEDFNRAERAKKFDRETRNTNLMVGAIAIFIISVVAYGMYDDYIKGETIVTLSSQLEECQLKLQPK